LRGRDWENSSSRLAQVEFVVSILTSGWGQWWVPVISAKQGSTVGGSQSRPGLKARLCLRNNQLGNGSRGTVPA
jgi:hypothetical protein